MLEASNVNCQQFLDTTHDALASTVPKEVLQCVPDVLKFSHLHLGEPGVNYIVDAVNGE
jgi:hypothetical protein